MSLDVIKVPHLADGQLKQGEVTGITVPSLDVLDVHGAVAKGRELLETPDGHFGVDVLWVPPYHTFPVHAHPGHHMLMSIGGLGTISIDRETFTVEPGDLYMVEGRIPHAVGASGLGHVLLSFGAPHKKVDSPERMWPTDWDGVTVEVPIASDGKPMCLCGQGENARDHEPGCPRL